MAQTLGRYRSVWEKKPVLRVVYDDFFQRIAGRCVEGITLEIGGGSGNLKDKLPDVIASDIQFGPWLDIVADAQRLPFADGKLSNIVMLDVLHHIEFPVAFFREAERVLRPGGRVVMIEPAITWGSTLFYRFIHEEPVVMSANPLDSGDPDPHRDPYASNQAVPTLLATRDRNRLHAAFPTLRMAEVRWFSLAVYPLSGGFQRWSLLTPRIANMGLKVEKMIEPWVGKYAGFRVLLVVEKAGEAPGKI